MKTGKNTFRLSLDTGKKSGTFQPLDRSHVIAQLIEYCTDNAKVVVSNPVHSLKMFSGHFPSSVMTVFASLITATFNVVKCNLS